MKKRLARLAAVGLALAALGLSSAQPAAAQTPSWPAASGCANQQPWLDHSWLSRILPMPACRAPHSHIGRRRPVCQHYWPDGHTGCL